MNQLDKWNKEIEALSSRRYSNMDSEIYNFYKDTLKQMKIEIKDYLELYEELSFSKRLELENQFKRAGRIDEILSDLSGKTTQSVTDYVRDELQLGYNGVWYAIEGAENVQLDFGMLPERYINELVTKRVDGKNFSTRLYQYRKQLADRTTTALLSAAANGEGYRKVAKQIGELTEANYKQALRIARTEGGRVQSTAKQKAYEEAEAIGVELEKQWMSTLDKKTRSSHQSLDGQTVGVDDDFVSENGHKAKGPRLFNVASEDINCRCTTITNVKGISPATRKDNESKEIIEYTNYKDWAEAKGYSKPEVKFKQVLEDVDFTKSRRSQAKQVLKNLGLEDVPVSVKKANSRGYCRIGIDQEGKATITEYVLESTDDRSSVYQTKTLFHEAYHAMGHDRLTDMRSLDYGSIRWLDIEETFAETSAHYANIQAGFKHKISPSYPDKLVEILPRLKQTDKFKKAKTLSDFGEVAWNDRLNGRASTWLELAKEVEAIDHDWIEYSKQYKDYITENRDKLMDKMLENMPSNKDFKDYMLTDLNNALEKIDNDDLTGFTGNENMIYSNILANAMNEIGVK